MDLIMGEHCIEESRERGTRPAHKVSTKNQTSVTTLSKEAWDASQIVVRPHSLKMLARAERTLRKASGLIMIDRSTAGATAGGVRGEGAGFFPLPFFVGTISVKRGEPEPDWRRRLELEEEGKVGGERAAEKGTTVCNYGSA